jgi:hypothetical protein
MSQGRLSRLPCLLLLLIVVAIQGITPDAQDLASTRTLRLIATTLTDRDLPAEHDEWPDDVCNPASCADTVKLPWSRRQLEWYRPIIADAMTQVLSRPFDFTRNLLHACPGRTASIGARLCLLGRLIC